MTHNPWVVLQTVSPDRIASALSDPSFRSCVDGLVSTNRESLAAPAWFQRNHEGAPLTCAAYFSMEFMLSEALPIYSGGLGNVAGDQLKAASDLGVPVIGVGLLYQRGYFRQALTRNGEQQALYPFNDPGQLPITPLRQPNGEWLRLEVRLPGYSVWLRTWQVQVGRIKLYLLDSNDAANYPVHRGITSELYGGDSELRLKQELTLGLADGACSARSGLNPKSATSTRAMPPSPSWSGRAILWRKRGSLSTSRLPPRAPATYSPPTPRSLPGSIDSLPPSSGNT